MRKVTFRSLVADYRRNKMQSELEGEWGVILFYRPLSFVLVWVLARIGFSPSAITTAAILLLPVMMALAFGVRPDIAFPAICLLGILHSTLDCADGTLARATGRTSALGYYLDMINDLLYRAVMYGALGYLADRILQDDRPYAFGFALAAAWLMIFARFSRLYRDTEIAPDRKPAAKGAATRMDLGRLLYIILSGIDPLLPFIALALWWAGALPWLFVWLIGYGAADALHGQLDNLALLRRRRRAR